MAAAFVSAWGVGARQPERPWAREPPQAGEKLGWPRVRWKDGPEEARPGAWKDTETPDPGWARTVGRQSKRISPSGSREKGSVFLQLCTKGPVVKCEEETGSLRPER